jgi:hypothetical protein
LSASSTTNEDRSEPSHVWSHGDATDVDDMLTRWYVGRSPRPLLEDRSRTWGEPGGWQHGVVPNQTLTWSLRSSNSSAIVVMFRTSYSRVL